MKNLVRTNETENRAAHGGSYYCKVCGKTSGSYWTIFRHIASRHVGTWTTNFYSLIMKVF